MNAKDAIRATMDMNRNVVSKYLSDMSDADLLVRPVPEANHIAWQLGHLIAAECRFIKDCGGTPPELPAGFAEQHSKDTTKSDRGFRSKAEYLDLQTKVRQAALARLADMSEADLDKPTTGTMAKFFPTLGRLFTLIANHELMHAGQFAVVRRKLGKPVLM